MNKTHLARIQSDAENIIGQIHGGRIGTRPAALKLAESVRDLAAELQNLPEPIEATLEEAPAYHHEPKVETVQHTGPDLQTRNPAKGRAKRPR